MLRFGLLVGLLLAAGCGRSGRPIELVVPDGHRGPIWIGPDPSAAAIPVVDGRYQAAIPPGGVLWVNSLGPLHGRHEFSARYADGSVIRRRFDGSALAPDAVALRGGESMMAHRGGREYRFIRYFVGTEAGASAFLNDDAQLLPGEVP